MAASVAKYRGEGYHKFQLKVGGDPDTDMDRIRLRPRNSNRGEVLIADANTGWSQHQALRVAAAVRDIDVYIEQPCMSYDECLAVRRHTDRPFILDEVIDRFGDGRTRLCGSSDGRDQPKNFESRRAHSRPRKFAICAFRLASLLPSRIRGAGMSLPAAIAHLAHSTPPEYAFPTTDFNSYVTVSTAESAPKRRNGRMSAPGGPGLGIRPRMNVLGAPVLHVN